MTGRPPEAEVAEVMRAIAMHPEPVITARDIHEDIGLGPDGARERLKRLEEQGYLKSKKVGASALVFWLSDKGRDTLANMD